MKILKFLMFNLFVFCLFCSGIFAQENEVSKQILLEGEITNFEISLSNPDILYAIKDYNKHELEEVSPGDIQIYVKTQESGLYRSNDGGENWEKIHKKPFRAIKTHDSFSHVLYAIESG
ncbi:hypothetical protein ACFL67_02735 [candidate division KSB1 bacterium]